MQRHLDAEDPDTDSIEVARLWVHAYDELVAFEERMLARLTEMLPALSTEARQEAELTNLPMIVQHLQTFRYRHAHWKLRVQDLDGHEP